MATSRKRRLNSSQGLISSLEERHASRFPCKDIDVEWLTLAANCHFDFAKLFASSVHGGSFGKTFRLRLEPNEVEHFHQSCGGLMNAGMGSHGECLTLNISESPKDGAECLLSQVVDRGDTLLRSYLNREQMQKMLARLEKYKQENCLTDALRMALSDGAEMKRQSVEST